MKNYGWLIYNGCTNSLKFDEIKDMLLKSAKENNIVLEPVRNNEILVTIDNGCSVLKGKQNLKNPDFVLFWDKDIRLAKHLEKMGFRLFNSAETIEICDDKSLTHQILADNNIKMPKTIISNLVFPFNSENDDSYIELLEDELLYPMIIKESFGSFGFQVYLISNSDELKQKRKELLHKPHIYQEFISSSKGRDLRLQVVGNEVVASMQRVSEVDFRANITNGGKMSAYNPEREYIDLAVKSASLVKADFAGVDLLFGKDNEPILCEINSNAHFKNLFVCTGINTANYIINHIKRCM